MGALLNVKQYIDGQARNSEGILIALNTLVYS